MTKEEHKKIKDLIHKIGLRYGLSDDVVKRIVNSPFEFAHSILSVVELDGIKSEEELETKKTNFNLIPCEVYYKYILDILFRNFILINCDFKNHFSIKYLNNLI